MGTGLRENMDRRTFLIAGLLSLAISFSGFYFLLRNQYVLSLLQIALGGIIFYLILRKAKKETWFGKPVK
jgi:hypothetical protein